jgi:hypothetical protein
MQKQHRWLKAAIIACAVPQPPLPWTRDKRPAATQERRPATAKPLPLSQK